MSVINTFMNVGGGLMKDLTPFVTISSGGEIDYAQYSITRYPGTGSNYTHFFSGYVHFSKAPSYDATVTITIPESYKINAPTPMNLTVAVKSDKANSYSSERFEIINNSTAIRFTAHAFQGFIFPSFLCYK